MKKIKLIIFVLLFLVSCDGKPTFFNNKPEVLYYPPYGLIEFCKNMDETKLINEPECDFYRCSEILKEKMSEDETCKYYKNGTMWSGFSK